MTDPARAPLRTLIAQWLHEEGLIDDKGIQTRTPTHGSCCTCQDCGFYYDDCRCDLNRRNAAWEALALLGEPETPAPAWQPIATAPKDGTRIMAFAMIQPMPGRDVVPHMWITSWWFGDALNRARWGICELAQPTHWMPLPQPPAESPVSPGAPAKEDEDLTRRGTQADSSVSSPPQRNTGDVRSLTRGSERAMNLTECGVCKGQGRVLIVNCTAGPPQEIQTCSNCGGQGMIWAFGTFAITFKRSDELPPTVWKKGYTRFGVDGGASGDAHEVTTPANPKEQTSAPAESPVSGGKS